MACRTEPDSISYEFAPLKHNIALKIIVSWHKLPITIHHAVSDISCCVISNTSM